VKDTKEVLHVKPRGTYTNHGTLKHEATTAVAQKRLLSMFEGTSVPYYLS